jgi:hypothetical protein
MLSRHAILIANSIAYGIRSKNIPGTVINSIIQDFSTRLDNLGEYTFETTTVVNETTAKATEKIRVAIKHASKTGDLLVIYYFGHAVRPLNSDTDLYFFFNDSDWLDLPSMLDFSDIVKWLSAYKPNKVVIILDCCYAGAIGSKLRLLEKYNGQYYLMASVTYKNKAEVDYSDDRPVGVFTKHLLSGFANPKARIPLGHDVTFESLFNFAAERTKEQSKQLPIQADNGAGKDVFLRQVLVPTIAPGIRTSVPQKSAYYKLFVLSSFLLMRDFKDEDSLYSFVASREPRQFLTPVKTKPDTIEYRFMGQDSFFWYLDLCRDLGLIREGYPLQLTALGKSMLRRDGSHFNENLFTVVRSIWKEYGIDLSDIEQAIGTRMRNNGIPTTDGIYFELYVTKKLKMSKDYFRVLLDLTAYVGALRYSREHTFFMPTISGDPEREGQLI